MKPLLKCRPASLEQAKAALRHEVPEERQVQLKASVRAVAGLRKHLAEAGTAGPRDAVCLATPLAFGGFDEPALLQTTERRVEGTKRDLPEAEIAEGAFQFVAVPRLFTKQSKDGEVEHLWSPIYRIDITISNRYKICHPFGGPRHTRPLTSLR